ncbi:hypothetical protein KBB96_18440 [Luteolibacter ambystomatis]|uniref:Enterotoxin n=1 Tax=Luteolibacter ambystomatis TaxID=2824561 RepID=A0A975G8U2_9BACT|nr:hypothetical protein [Luteolibacter ambystomatis]QUE50825.1 hypothetical protein KBB96_18440 [Luteolibacter ambystomatis]
MKPFRPFWFVALAFALSPLSLHAAPAEAPAAVSSSESAITDSRAVIANDKLSLTVVLDEGRVTGVRLADKVNGRLYDLGTKLFEFSGEETDDEYGKPQEFTRSSSCWIASKPVAGKIEAKADARRLADRVAGQTLEIRFAWDASGNEVVWRAELRDGAPYLRQTVTFTPHMGNGDIKQIKLLDFSADNARTQGTVQGVPVTINDSLFCGVEHPMAENSVKDGRVTGLLARKTKVANHKNLVVSSIVGVAAPGQLRRTFQLGYVNIERVRPYEPFLNYNTWYDIGYFSRYDEKAALDVVRAYGEELVKKRGVKVDSFLFDDGWDDPATLWQFNKGMPNEFKEVRKLAESYGASPGVWFSPWGGYGPPKDARIAAANTGLEKGKEYETNETGFALSGKNYYKLFRDMCLRMIRDNGINHFKFDGTGDAGKVQPGSDFGSDFEAVIALIADLRKERPDLYINLTTGTWASPFWFGTADSIWRGNYDHEFIGTGTHRQQWITFRDANIYKNNVAVSPLFPINSLMVHGVIYAKHARWLNEDPGNNLPEEIWSGFAYGTQMEELYVTPSLLSQENWDTIAAAAKWARGNSATLVDTHWIGGDPAKLETYGWASWSKEKGILCLRNPSDREQHFSATPASLFELPAGAAGSYKLVSPKGDTAPGDGTIAADKPLAITLKPFQVLVFEALPQK